MPRCSAAWRTASGGSTTLPIASLYATAVVRPRVVEVGCFNTNTTQTVAIALRRLITSTGTRGTLQTPVFQDDPEATTIQAQPYDTHTVAPTLAAGVIRQTTLAPYNGIIWTFQEPGLLIPAAAVNAIALVTATGTGSVCDVSFTWIE